MQSTPRIRFYVNILTGKYMTFVDRFLKSKLTIWVILVIHFIIWILFFTVLDVHPDMADHWIWSRYLSLGYYEHPPFVALTMRLVTLVFSDIVFGLKLGSVLFSVLILLMGYLTAKTLYDTRTALVYVLILTATPYFSMGSLFWHIDQPYMLFWLICLLVMVKQMNSGNANWMLLFGVSAGLGSMSKYIMILLPLSMLIWCVVNIEARKLLTKWQTYAGALIALLIVFPNIYWNYHNEWVTFNFVLDKGLKGASFGVHFLHFITSQFVLFSIVYSVYFWWKLVTKNLNSQTLFEGNGKASQKHSFLLITGLVTMALFTVTSFLGSRTDPHWVNVAYFSFFLMLARYISTEISQGRIGKQVFLFFGSTAFNFTILIIVLLQIHYIFIPVKFPDAPSLRNLAAWEMTADQIEELCEEKRLDLPPFVISREYQLASVLGLYLEDHPWPHSIEKALRNQWSPVEKVKSQGALLICPTRECTKLLQKAEKRFSSSFRYLGEIKTQHNGKVMRKLKVFYLEP